MVNRVIRALLVEDSLETCRLAMDWPGGRVGISLVRTRHLADASTFLRQQAFDVVLLDLPDAVDVASIRSLHDAAPALPIVVIAASEDPVTAYRAVRHGAQDVVPRRAATPSCLQRTILTSIERKRQEQHKIRYARIDELTGLANLLLLEERFERAVARADRQATLIGLVAVDLDQVDELLDRHGRAVLDRWLPLVGARLMTEVRRTDTLARTREYGFTWLVEGLSAIEDINVLVNRLPRLLADPFTVDQREIRATASVGVAIAPFHGRQFADLHAMAEAAMFDVASMSGDGLLMPLLPSVAEIALSGAPAS